METNQIERMARTESLFREVNERIAEAAERFDAARTNFVCECSDPRCTNRVEASLIQYERVREDGNAFLLEPGHEDERVEAVVRSSGKHAVVEKQHPVARRLVLELDPRAA